jgi:hypothetical protein
MAWTCPCGTNNGDDLRTCRSCSRPLFEGTLSPISYPSQQPNWTPAPLPQININYPQKPSAINDLRAMGGMEAAKLSFGGSAGLAAGWTVGKFAGCMVVIVAIAVILFLVGAFARLFTASDNKKTVIPAAITTLNTGAKEAPSESTEPSAQRSARPVNGKISEQEFVERCVRNTTALTAAAADVARRSCECALKTYRQTGSTEQAASAAQACLADGGAATSAVPSPQLFADADVRPFTGKISDYPQYAIDAQVSIGNWIYKLNRMNKILASKHLRHSEFGPFGDSNTMVLAIEVIVRNAGTSPARLPPFKVITKELVGTNDGPQPQWLEYDQYSAGYIERHLDSSVAFNPGEQLMGVIAFECCVNKGTQAAFLHVSDGSGKSAEISLMDQNSAASPAQTSNQTGDPPMVRRDATIPKQAPASSTGCSDPVATYKPTAPDDRRGPPAKFNAVALIDENGSVAEISFPTYPDIQSFDRPLTDAWVPEYQKMVRQNLMQWKFTPAICNGSPVQRWTSVEFRFHYRQ